MNDTSSIKLDLLQLSHELGMPWHNLAILAEGNTSACINDETFLVKSSGSQLHDLRPDQVVEVKFKQILTMIDADFDDDQVQAALQNALVKPNAAQPSVETAVHGWLLKQEGVHFVGHTHPVAVNKILCSDKSTLFAENRLFPDEVVCCGPKSLLIDYADPGVSLAQIIRDGWQRFVAENDFIPRLILLKNHGLIAVGKSPASVIATTLMAVKAAEIFVGASTIGTPVFMQPDQVARIYSRKDEHYRQKQLNLK